MQQQRTHDSKMPKQVARGKRKAASIYATKAQGRPMANGGGMHRARKRLRKQVKTALRQGLYYFITPVKSIL